ncbi:hypothetical protein GCM10010452_47870 [Crossiella cryophila]
MRRTGRFRLVEAVRCARSRIVGQARRIANNPIERQDPNAKATKTAVFAFRRGTVAAADPGTGRSRTRQAPATTGGNGRSPVARGRSKGKRQRPRAEGKRPGPAARAKRLGPSAMGSAPAPAGPRPE